MRVIGSSAWIEWFIASPTAALLEAVWPSREETLVQFELVKWATREASDDLADQIVAYTQTCRVAPLDTVIALRAAEMSRVHTLAMADAIIYSTALQHDADCLTCDRHFEGLDGVVLVGKV